MDVIAQTMPIDEDLGDFSGWLRQQGIAHRISEHNGAQVLRVDSAETVERVQFLYRQFKSGELKIIRTSNPDATAPGHGGWQRAIAQAPVTLMLIALSVCGAALVAVDSSFAWVSLLTFSDPYSGHSALPPPAQFWRVITPLFLHFGALHICFNALWTWELGRRIEMAQGSARILVLTLLVGIGSNFAQAMVTGAVIFGGMSGVIYGLLGYCVVWSRLRPQQSFQINNGVVIFMIAWLVLCYAGLSRLVAGVDTANTAHLSGLLLGGLAGVITALRSPRR